VRLAERIAEYAPLSDGSISRIENGKQPYKQAFLEAAAGALDCTPADILERDPTLPEYTAWRIITGLKPEEREQATRILAAAFSKVA
jgi:transcriptional regulator with XRE-family HTH domain